MAIPVTCDCGRTFKAKDEHAGLRAKCPSCQAVIQIPGVEQEDFESLSGLLPEDDGGGIIPGSGGRSLPPTDEIRLLLREMVGLLKAQNGAGAVRSGGAKEYKILTQKDKWFSGKFDPERLEQAINAYAGQGWEVTGMATASFPGFGGAREEIIVLLERDHG